MVELRFGVQGKEELLYLLKNSREAAYVRRNICARERSLRHIFHARVAMNILLSARCLDNTVT